MDPSNELTGTMESVIKEMIGGKDIAVAFSGGLDCGIVAAIAKKYASSVTLYTAGVDDAYDVRESEEVSKILGLPWHHIRIAEEDLEENLQEMVDITGTSNPITLSFEIPLFYVAKNCKEDIIIGGQGADELFAGYSKYIGLTEDGFRELRNDDMVRLFTETLKHESSVCDHFSKTICYPYLDRRVMDIVERMDMKDLMPGDVRKARLREVAEAIGQPEVAAKKKKAAQYGSGAMNLFRKVAKNKNRTVSEMVDGMLAVRHKKELTDWLYGLSMHGIKLGLTNIKELLRRLGNPQDSFRSIHVAGTDGKGSTCAMLYSIFRESGISTGLYTSPHILEFNERISVNGVRITDDELSALVEKVRPIIEDMRADGMQCTFFEAATAIGFQYFKDKCVEYAIVEVGMGGRFDATNVIVPEASVIANISMEHTEYLGDTIQKIAFEKAGIIKKGVPVITNNKGDALKVITDVASEVGADVFIADEAEVVSLTETSTEMVYRGRNYVLGIPGGYQAMNAEMVIETIQHISCRNRLSEHIDDGLRNVRWPCRMEKIDGMPVIVDASHTKAGSKVMTDSILQIYGKVAVVFGVLSDKDINGIAENLSHITDKIILTTPISERAAPLEKVESILRTYFDDVTVCPDVYEAMDLGLRTREGKDLLITGSFFMSEAALKWLKRTSAGY